MRLTASERAEREALRAIERSDTYGAIGCEAYDLLDEIRQAIENGPSLDAASWGDIAKLEEVVRHLSEAADRLLRQGEYAARTAPLCGMCDHTVAVHQIVDRADHGYVAAPGSSSV